MSTDEIIFYFDKEKQPFASICSKDNWKTFLERIKPTLSWVLFVALVHIIWIADALPTTNRLVYGLHASQNETDNNFGGSMGPEFYYTYTPGSAANDPGNLVGGETRTGNTVALADQSTYKVVRDPRFNYPYDKKREIVPKLEMFLVDVVPFILNLFLLRGTAMWYYATIVGVSHAMMAVIKNAVGAIRPNFYQRCEFDDAKGKCMNEEEEKRGRRSFPSGHSWITAAVMTFSAFDWISLLCATWPKGRAHFSIFALIPMFITFYIAFSRFVDYNHFLHDIIGGVASGLATGYFFFKVMLRARKDAAGPSIEPKVPEKMSELDKVELIVEPEEGTPCRHEVCVY
eukprot:GEMP01011184.1.p1 GENE.GEMP01011184.1~~GEMP01011184.1.p1  ORF type:complete len:344 (-),score=59.53 GEMP01011184.1:2170-3201(-)